jgi:hypothetical protein
VNHFIIASKAKQSIEVPLACFALLAMTIRHDAIMLQKRKVPEMQRIPTPLILKRCVRRIFVNQTPDDRPG